MKIKYQPHYNPVWQDPKASNGWMGVGTRPRKKKNLQGKTISDGLIYFFDRDYEILGSVEFIGHEIFFLPPLLRACHEGTHDTLIRDGDHRVIGKATCINQPDIPTALALWKKHRKIYDDAKTQ